MKKIYTFALTIIMCAGLSAQVDFQKLPQPILEKGSAGSWDTGGSFSPSILKLDGTYHLWFTGSNDANEMTIGYATSTDGLNWEKYENNPVLEPGPDSYDQGYVYLPNVEHDGTVFHMYYVGADESGNENLLYATSLDGISWDKQGALVFLDENGDPYNGYINRGDVYYDGAFHMWAGMGSRGIYDVGYATSEDGATWTLIDSVVIEKPTSGQWDYPRHQVSTVFELGNIYHMWYSGGDLFDWDIGYAYSPDGLNWTKYDENPVLTRGESGAWDNNYVAFPTVMVDPEDFLLKIWYSGAATGGLGATGYAEAIYENSVTGIIHSEVKNDENLLLYPNPAQTYFNVKTGKEEQGFVEIHSMNGQLIHKEKLNAGTQRIDVSGLAVGIYAVKINIESEILTSMLVIEHP